MTVTKIYAPNCCVTHGHYLHYQNLINYHQTFMLQECCFPASLVTQYYTYTLTLDPAVNSMRTRVWQAVHSAVLVPRTGAFVFRARYVNGPPSHASRTRLMRNNSYARVRPLARVITRNWANTYRTISRVFAHVLCVRNRARSRNQTQYFTRELL